MRYVQRWSEERGWHLVPRDEDTTEPKAAAVFGDLPDYESPVTGNVVSGRAARREDLKRSNCRPYEPGEREEARKRFEASERRWQEAIADRLRWVGA